MILSLLGSRWAPVALVGLYLAVGVLYTESVPPWEAPDEPWHLAYSEALAAGRLPGPDDTYQYHHPPLYYLWPALALRATGWRSLARAPDNPRYPFAAAAYLHGPEPMTQQAQQGTTSGRLRFLRTFSGLLGCLAVALAWSTARAVMPGRREQVLAAGVLALWPQFQFISHSISNDVLATVMGGLTVYAMLKWLVAVTTPSPTARSATHWAIAVAVSLALGLWTKLNVLAVWVVVPVGWMLAVTAIPMGRVPTGGIRLARERVVRQTIVAGLIAIVGVLVSAATFAAAAPATFAAMMSAATRRGTVDVGGASIGGAWTTQFQELAASFWARFGWMNVNFPRVATLAALIVFAFGLLGLFKAWRRSDDDGRRRIVLLSAGAVAALLAVLQNLVADQQAQGRLLFPALPALIVLWSRGWGSWRIPSAFTSVVAVGLLLSSLYATVHLLPAAYATSRLATTAEVAARILPVPWTVAARIEGPAGYARQTFQVDSADLVRVEVPVFDVVGDGVLQVALWRLAESETAEAGGGSNENGEVSRGIGAIIAKADFPLHDLNPDDWAGIELPHTNLPGGRRFALELAVVDGKGAVRFWGATDGAQYAEGKLVVNGRPGTDLALLAWRRVGTR